MSDVVELAERERTSHGIMSLPLALPGRAFIISYCVLPFEENAE